jgi:hypothetical protein
MSNYEKYRHSPEDDEVVAVTQASEPVTGWMVGRVVEIASSEDGIPESMSQGLIIALSTDDNTVVARFDLSIAEEFANDILNRLHRRGEESDYDDYESDHDDE